MDELEIVCNFCRMHYGLTDLRIVGDRVHADKAYVRPEANHAGGMDNYFVMVVNKADEMSREELLAAQI